MSDTIFSRIIDGEFGTEFIYEDDICVAFRDINPKEKTHLLIVPKKPIPSIMEADESDEFLLGHLLFVCKKIGEMLKLPGYQLKINVGEHGGQEIFHLHIHLLSKF
ncbi:histidine triad nucleotide-binding protein [Candidatus Peregrinibacteria bacterium CG10_big_fil_rev_8_21_14_0_10_36_19]|nr:MAG: histidine triad nucleotide-binding protein [Candidatus Peregrinibacteria bacterium CG10_big_fil_rev_8_21_14_0_10_36_19]